MSATKLPESTLAPYTVVLYQGSVVADKLEIVPGMTEEEIGNWVHKHIRRAESDLRALRTT